MTAIQKKNERYNKIVDETLKKLINLFGKHLVSVSSSLLATDEFKPMLLIQLDEPLTVLLRDKKVSPNGKSIKAVLKKVADLQIHITTTREMADFAADFPIELVHIKKRYRRLYGDDPIVNMDVNFENVHSAVSVSIQEVLMRLRTAYLSQHYDGLLVKNTVIQLYPTFESALYLRSQSIPTGLREVVFKVESCYNTKSGVLSEIAQSISMNKRSILVRNMLALLLALEEILAGVKGLKGIGAAQ